MSRKLVVILIFILLLLPFVSWYYLRSGLQWRKEAQAYMDGKTPFPSGSFLDANAKKFSSDDLTGHVTLVSFISCTNTENQTELIHSLHSQFKETGKALFILLDSCEASNPKVSLVSLKGTHYFTCVDSISLCKEIGMDWPAGKPIALVDRHGIIRGYYPTETQEDKKRMLENLALLLPRERQEKVELRRGEKR